jgi:hypothetical protein
MKPNPQFDTATLQWWRLTNKRVIELAQMVRQFRHVNTGNQRNVATGARGELKRLAATRRDVFRAGTAI